VEIKRYGQGDDELRVRMMVAAQYDAPAYIRRARGVEVAFEDLLARCRRQRTEWLFGVRLHLGALRAGASSWDVLRPLLADGGQVAALERLHAEAGDPDVPMTGPAGVPACGSPRGRRRALARLRASVERFNRRWLAFIDRLDLGEVNRLRDGYNRYYLLEKECAVGPARLLPQTFRKLPPVATADVLDRLPPLPVLRPRE
jgi:hypothetical protein